MGPVRASTSNNQLGNSSSASTDRKFRKKRDSNPYNGGNSKANDDASDLPGVQKLKSVLRQTRRLLAKDTLAADVRVETERRLRALEADLETAERNRKERTLATKYHKVKFFERKKVLRKIKQVKKELAEVEADSYASSKKASTRLEHALFELRVDLNYILNYPKLEKYIALYPSDSERPDPEETVPEQSETTARRKALRERIRQMMDAGELNGEPELEHEMDIDKRNSISAPHRAIEPVSAPKVQKLQKKGREKSDRDGRPMDSARVPGKVAQKVTQRGKEKTKAGGVSDDDFFDAGPESASDSDAGSRSFGE